MRNAIASITVFLMIVLSLCACARENVGSTWQEQYDLGMRYLSDGNYEEAIIAFTAAIKIDSKRPEAFLGRGDAYEELGDLERAAADYQGRALADGLQSSASNDSGFRGTGRDEYRNSQEHLRVISLCQIQSNER